MARAPRKTALTSSPNPQLERQARRISRQQKQLAKELAMEAAPLQVKLTGAGSRAIKLSNLKRLQPLTDTQEDFFDAYDNPDNMAFVLYGSSGTGKSTIALYLALREVLDDENSKEKLIIIRSAVQTRDQGFLPGALELKMEPFSLPYHGICEFLTGRKDAYEKLVEMGKIEFLSSSMLRGSTFDDAIVVVDENQSMTWHELSTITTRVGKNTKVIFCGDYAQNDLITKKTDVSGFREFLDVTMRMSEFSHFKFTPDDILRSHFVKQFIIQCELLGI
jgi:phosphate starvation-inducible protein PhoH and related proteins